jgi:hypothetical protein
MVFICGFHSRTLNFLWLPCGKFLPLASRLYCTFILHFLVLSCTLCLRFQALSCTFSYECPPPLLHFSLTTLSYTLLHFCHFNFTCSHFIALFDTFLHFLLLIIAPYCTFRNFLFQIYQNLKWWNLVCTQPAGTASSVLQVK